MEAKMSEPLIDKELNLSDLLDDPLVALVMASDGVTPEELRAQMFVAQRQMTAVEKRCARKPIPVGCPSHQLASA